MTTSQSFSSSSPKKAVSISLASVVFQACPYYFTFNNNIHELYHIKGKHDYSVVCVSEVSKMLSMITNSVELFSLWRVRTEAPKKQRMLKLLTDFCAHQGCWTHTQTKSTIKAMQKTPCAKHLPQVHGRSSASFTAYVKSLHFFPLNQISY